MGSCSSEGQLLVLGLGGGRVLSRGGRSVLTPLRHTLERVHHAAHEHGAEEVLERREDVGVEEQREEADDDEEADDGQVDKLGGKLDQTFVVEDERQRSHDTRLCQPINSHPSV